MSKINASGRSEEFLFEYSLFLLTSARGLAGEPRLYGALRLLDGMSRLTGLYSTTDKIVPDPFLLKMKADIDANVNKVMKSDEEFIQFMDELITKFTTEMKRRYSKSNVL